MAALAGGAVGLGGGMSALLASCGGSSETETTSAATSSSAAATTASSAEESSTTVSAGAEIGRAIKLGYVIPVTGSLAPFATSCKWALQHFTDAIGDGLVCGDNKKHAVEMKLVDTQSDSNRAAQVAGDLIQNTQVDMILTAVTPDTVNPCADVAEAMGCPLISSFTEWHAFTTGRSAPAEGFKWTYTYSFDDTATAAGYLAASSQIQTNKVAGLVLANDVDGNNWAKWAPKVLEGGGFQVVATDMYNPGTEDFTAQIAALKKSGCEILIGTMFTPDFSNFWAQVHQQGFKPKVVCVNKALTFPEAVTAMGDLGHDLCCDVSIGPRAKWIDSLTGMTWKELCEQYEAFSGAQWTEAQIGLLLFEWAADILKRTPDIEDKQGIVTAIKGTKLDCCLGTIDFTAPVVDGLGGGKHHPHINACTSPQGTGQWVKATSGKWPMDKVVVATLDSGSGYNSMEIEATVKPITYVS